MLQYIILLLCGKREISLETNGNTGYGKCEKSHNTIVKVTLIKTNDSVEDISKYRKTVVKLLAMW